MCVCVIASESNRLRKLLVAAPAQRFSKPVLEKQHSVFVVAVPVDSFLLFMQGDVILIAQSRTHMHAANTDLQ